ncbi:MAG: DUF3307 domain-containing protein [Breznakia sp.]
MNLILAMLLAHSLGDFYFQTNRMASKKEKYIVGHIIIYTATIMMIYWLMTRSKDVVVLGILVLISHFLIDWLNLYISKKNLNISLLIFILDQILHVAVLISFLIMYDGIVVIKEQVNHILLFITIILYLIMPSSILIDKVLCTVDKDPSLKRFLLDEGTVIGILERMLILVMGISGSINGIGFLIAAKTMVRYGQFDDQGKNNNFRSKYLIGTLLSVLLGFLLYVCFDWIK